MMNWVVAATLVFGASILTSCSNDDNPTEQRGEYVGVPLIILDTDIGSSTDDLFTMMMLYRYEEQNRCRVLGVVVDREGEDCAAYADVMNTYFGHGDVPVGLVRNGIKNPKVWIDYKPLPMHTDTDGKPLFRRSIADYSSLPDGYVLYRQLLATQPDHSVSIVSIGFVTCLAQLLRSAPDSYSSLNGIELVRRKVKCLYMMGGVFGNAKEPIEYNFAQGVAFAQTFFLLWPSDIDIIMTPGEVGDGIDYWPETVIADIDWTNVHPIKQVYMKCACDTDQKMWGPLTAINAVEGNVLFTLSERGIVTVSDKGESFFTPSPTSNIRYHLPGTEAWAAHMLEKIRHANKQR